ncbi:MAG: TIGR01777 family oxidoreductase [Verrucomicrobiota bacterium]
MSGKKVVIAGGSGLLGRRLKRVLLEQGVAVVVLSRKPQPSKEAGYREVAWTGYDQSAWHQELDGADVLINLTGKNVNCRYTPENRQAILDSRLQPIRQLTVAMQRATNPPALWIQAAGISIYGDAGNRFCDEDSEITQTQRRTLQHEVFLPDVCQQWEAAFDGADLPGTRKVLLRISSVLAPEAGALRLLTPLTRWGLGGCILPGTQYMSWIHIEDWVRCILWLIRTQDASGIYNMTAPHPVTNREFMQTLRATLQRPWSPPVPVAALQLGCYFMQTEPVLAQASIRAIPQRLQRAGFSFRYPELPDALHHLYPTKGTPT